MKQTIEIEVPEGYEVAEGVQPRIAMPDEYILVDGRAIEPTITTSKRYIVLKKKAPKYKTSKNSSLQTAESLEWVEIKALQDALRIINEHTNKYDFSESERETVKALKKLTHESRTKI